MLKSFFVIAFLMASHCSYAQETISRNSSSYPITGKVLDSLTQNGLGYATILLMEIGAYQSPPTTTVSDHNGFFILEGEINKSYVLKVSYMGFNSATIEFSTTKSTSKKLDLIILSPTITHLEEIEIRAERPLIENDLDKLIYNVEFDPESNTFSAFEILRKVPMISIDGEDNIQLNGSTSYQVLINGQTSSLFVQNPSEVFKNMPANTIKSIEIITNPPARFDAEGVGGIINVITHKKAISGYTGNVNLGIVSPAGAIVGGYLTGKARKVGISSAFGTKSTLSPKAGSDFFREDKISSIYLTQTGARASQNSFSYFSTELSYELGPLSLLKGNYRVNRSQGKNDFSQIIYLKNAEDEIVQSYKNSSNGQLQSNSSDILIEYLQNFRNHPQRVLTSSYKFSTNSIFNISDFSVQPLINYVGRNSQTENKNNTGDHTFQIDYIQPIKTHLFEVGIKSHIRRNSSDYFYQNEDPESGLYLIDLNQSNNFDYSQSINAAYTSFRFRFNKWGITTGARLEDTRVDANFRSSGTVANQRLHNLIPSLNISHELNNGKPLRLGYSQRLERPQMFHLNPYVNLLDPRNISFGNPALHPATNHIFNLGYNTYIKETSLSISLIHQFSNNSIQYFTTLGADTVARSTYGNIGQRKIYGLNFSGNTTLFNKLMISLNNTTNHTQIVRFVKNQPVQRKGLFLNFNSNVTYRINKTWRSSGNFGYISPQVLLQGKSAGYFSNSIAVNKDFLKNNKGMLSFSIQNPLQRYRRYFNEFDDPYFYQFQKSYTVIREFNLNFSYRFGKVQTRDFRNKSISIPNE